MSATYRQNVLWLPPLMTASVSNVMESAEAAYKRTLGATLIDLRIRAGITSMVKLVEILKEHGVASSEATVRRWEAGDGVPDAWEVSRLCVILGCEPDELIRPDPLTDREVQVLRRARRASRRGLDREAG